MKIRHYDLMMINAYVDGELDAAAALNIERRMEKEKALHTAHARVMALRAALSTPLTHATVSDSLLLKIENATNLPTQIRPLRFDWRHMAASIVIAAMIGSGATYFAAQQLSQIDNFDSIVAGHERSLLAATAVDVASSDHHTVKPWFDQHLAVSPPVPELASQGYVLVGGRVDVVGGKPVPTLVYKLRQHLISVVAVPNAAKDKGPTEPNFATRDGFSVLTWRAGDFVYSAVSDLAKTDLVDFQSKWRTASGEEQ